MTLPLRQFQLDRAVPQNLASWIHDRTKRLVEALLEAEVSQVLGRGSYQRAGEDRQDRMSRVSRNGYKLRWLKVGDSKLKMRLPQLRGTDEPFQSCLWRMLKSRCPKLDGFVLSLYADGPSPALMRQFMSVLDCAGTDQTQFGQYFEPLGESAIERAVESLREDFEHHARRSLNQVVPVCLSIGTIAVRIPQPHAAGIDKSFLVCFAKCGNGAEEVLSVSQVAGLEDERVPGIVDRLKARGLPPPLLFGGVSNQSLRAHVSKLFPATARRGYWEDVFHGKKLLLSPQVMPLAKAGWRHLLDGVE